MHVAKPQNSVGLLLGKIDFYLSRLVDRSKFYHSMPHEEGNQRNLLDIGCNDAKKLTYYDARGWQIHGIDISKPAIAARLSQQILNLNLLMLSGQIAYWNIWKNLSRR